MISQLPSSGLNCHAGLDIVKVDFGVKICFVVDVVFLVVELFLHIHLILDQLHRNAVFVDHLKYLLNLKKEFRENKPSSLPRL